jgi:hypothetical protein
MKRSKFSLSHYKMLTTDMGFLVPLTWYEILPGDTFQQSTSALIRVSPLMTPVMHPVRVRFHHWYVPLRLLWEDFEDFITGGDDGLQTPEHPYIDLTGAVAEGSLLDYLGIPPATYSGLHVSALPLRAYAFIYNNCYRDQDICSILPISEASGADATTSQDMVKVAWEKDYFTTARPWEQKGAEITIPIAGAAPVVTDGTDPIMYTPSGDRYIYAVSGQQGMYWNTAQGASGNARWGSNTGLEADLASATGIPIGDLRLSLALQRYQEARAKYGSQYVDYLRYLGVKSSDARMQRPEYLGGGRQVISFSEVLQTAEGADPVASMKGHGIAGIRTNRFRKFFEEHGIVMTLMSVIPKPVYANAINKSWLRTTREEYFQKELQFIGDQEISNLEVYSEHSSPTGVFGYQDRYDEYRYMPSSIAGEFRSTLDMWHMARIFSGDVALNQSFIDATPTKRVLASQDTDALYIMASHSIQARRILSYNPKSKTF